jgi:hypothetical protein
MAISGGIVLEEALNLSSDRLPDDDGSHWVNVFLGTLLLHSGFNPAEISNSQTNAIKQYRIRNVFLVWRRSSSVFFDRPSSAQTSVYWRSHGAAAILTFSKSKDDSPSVSLCFFTAVSVDYYPHN